jgi:hypothetical protein
MASRRLFPAILTVLVLTGIQTAGAAAALYRNKVRWKNSSGQELVMTFEELRRGDRTSTVTVGFNAAASTASVAGPMFIMRGLYDIATSRGATYFIKLKEWEMSDGSRENFLIGFSRSKRVDPRKYFHLKRALPKSEEYQFTSVKDFDLVFKDRQ